MCVITPRIGIDTMSDPEITVPAVQSTAAAAIFGSDYDNLLRMGATDATLSRITVLKSALLKSTAYFIAFANAKASLFPWVLTENPFNPKNVAPAYDRGSILCFNLLNT